MLKCEPGIDLICTRCGSQLRNERHSQRCRTKAELRRAVGRSPIAGVGERVAAALHRYGFATCRRCVSLAALMNSIGPAGCEAIFDDLVEKVLANARRPKPIDRSLRSKAMVGLARVLPDGLKRPMVARVVRDAIRDTRLEEMAKV